MSNKNISITMGVTRLRVPLPRSSEKISKERLTFLQGDRELNKEDGIVLSIKDGRVVLVVDTTNTTIVSLFKREKMPYSIMQGLNIVHSGEIMDDSVKRWFLKDFSTKEIIVLLSPVIFFISDIVTRFYLHYNPCL